LGFAACILLCTASLAEVEEPGEEAVFGVADIERILQDYWRTPQVKAELERYKTSEEFRIKQEEVARLERELSSSRRFAFFRDRRTSAEIQEKRAELRRLAEIEAQAAREREKEAIEQLLADIRRSAESIGGRSGYTAIFDSNNPHIVFMNTNLGKIVDITDEVIADLNFR
jgi:Skp family chaperone for outer membrane proteins